MSDPTQPTAILRHLLRAAAQPAGTWESIDAWWPVFVEQRDAWPLGIDQALAGGVAADRVGYAFAAGYQGAIHRLEPNLPANQVASFSVTEEGGGHPAAIESRLEEKGDGHFVLNGRKKWATMSSDGGIALVAACIGQDEQGRNRLRIARVDLGAPGVTVEAMPKTDFVPEIHHCRLTFSDVAIAESDLLAGDGYSDFVKPFRTVEDIHVSAALLAYLLRIAVEYGWETGAQEELVHLIAALRALAFADAKAPTTHVALEGLFKSRAALLERLAPEWSKVDAAVVERWQRDSPLTRIAGRVRALRAEAAWKALRD